MSLTISTQRSDLLKRKGLVEVSISVEEISSPLAVSGQLSDLLLSVMSKQGGLHENA